VTGQAVRIDNVNDRRPAGDWPPGHPPIGPLLAVPILEEGRSAGSLYLARAPGEAAFTDEDQRVAELLAAYAGVAIGNARLYRQALEATRAREDLLATVSHDLRNPLSTIRLASFSLGRAGLEGAPAEAVARIERAVGRLTRLIDDLLEAARIEAGVLRTTVQPEDATALIEATTELLRPAAAERSIELCTRTEPGLTVLCDRHLVMRVLANLITNSIKFSPPSGQVRVEADAGGGADVQFSVSDDGPGIPAEHLPHVFDRYWQPKGSDRGGSGLGLFIARGIVEAHGGRIRVESTPGHGTTMRFNLPRPARTGPADRDTAGAQGAWAAV
jgi:signal transduction histidine kinase